VATGLYFLVRRPFRRHGARYGHPILLLIEHDARKQAVRLGHAHTGTVELLLSTLDLHEQLHTAGMVLPEPAARHNSAGQILRGHGVTLLAATMAASNTQPPSRLPRTGPRYRSKAGLRQPEAAGSYHRWTQLRYWRSARPASPHGRPATRSPAQPTCCKAFFVTATTQPPGYYTPSASTPTPSPLMPN
jgi:hypothetical protein